MSIVGSCNLELLGELGLRTHAAGFNFCCLVSEELLQVLSHINELMWACFMLGAGWTLWRLLKDQICESKGFVTLTHLEFRLVMAW